MFNEEIEMTLECAVNVRKHLLRVIERTNESGLEQKLQFVNHLIIEANTMQDKEVKVVYA